MHAPTHIWMYVMHASIYLSICAMYMYSCLCACKIHYVYNLCKSCTCVCMYAYMHVFMYVCMCVNICIWCNGFTRAYMCMWTILDAMNVCMCMLDIHACHVCIMCVYICACIYVMQEGSIHSSKHARIYVRNY